MFRVLLPVKRAVFLQVVLFLDFINLIGGEKDVQKYIRKAKLLAISF